MYESPIELIYKNVQERLDNNILYAVQKVDIKVNKWELIKALEYDRKQYEKGMWEMFELITSVYYGKQNYFLEPNDRVYSRVSTKYLTVSEAIDEFLAAIGGTDE